MSKEISLVGFLGSKNSETGKYEIPIPILKAAYQYIIDKGLAELKVKEISSIIATEELGTGKIAAKLASKYNCVAKVIPIDWKSSDDKSEAARLRNVVVLENADKIILLRKGNTFGGQGLLDAIEQKKGVDVLIYDIDTGNGSVCKAQDIAENVKVAKRGVKALDYKKIAQHYLDNRLLITDVETSGLGTTSEVIQISFVEVNTGIVFLDTLIKPKGEMSPSAQAVHGISLEMLKDAPSFEEVFPAIDCLIRHHDCVAYNQAFDAAQIAQEYERIGKKMPKLRFEDAMPVISAALGEQVKLTVACERFGVKPGVHSAVSDCISLAEVIKILANSPEETK